MRQQCATKDAPILFLEFPDAGSPSATSDRTEIESGRLARAIIKARSVRRQLFDEHLFADPAWDMLLELFALRSEDHRVSVSKLSLAAGVPGTTGLRWIDKLETESLVFRIADPLDGRRVWIELSQQGVATMRAYLQRISVRRPAIWD